MDSDYEATLRFLQELAGYPMEVPDSSTAGYVTSGELAAYVRAVVDKTGVSASSGDIERIGRVLVADDADNFVTPSSPSLKDKHRKLADSYFLIRSILQNDVLSTKRMIEYGADVNARCWLDSDQTYFPLVQAAIVGSLEIVVLLVESGADVNQQQSNGETALANAANVASQEHLQIARYLLERGANPNVIAHHRITPLAIAENSQMVRLLLDYGADPNIGDDEGDLPIRARIDNGDWDSVSLMVVAGTDLDHRNKYGVSAREAASKLGVRLESQKESAGFASKGFAGADIRKLNELLLHELDHGGNAETIGGLLARGANPNQRFDDGCSALYVAAQCGYARAAGLLIDAGANINLKYEGAAPLHMAAQEGHVDTIRLLVGHGADVNAPGPSGASPLWCGIRYPEVCEALIVAGADVNQPHPEIGMTPLCYAAEISNSRTAELLVAAGADVNFCTTDGLYYYSPLASAIRTAEAGSAVELEELEERIAIIGLLANNGAKFVEAAYPTTPPGGRMVQKQRVDAARCDGRTTVLAGRLLEAARAAGLRDIPIALESIALMESHVME